MPRGLLVARFARIDHMNFGPFLPAEPAYQERVQMFSDTLLALATWHSCVAVSAAALAAEKPAMTKHRTGRRRSLWMSPESRPLYLGRGAGSVMALLVAFAPASMSIMIW